MGMNTAVSAQRGGVFAHVLVDSLLRWGDRPLFDQPAGEQSFSYRQTADLIARFIAVLERDGLGRGAGLGVLSNNRADSWMAAVAPQIAGGYYSALPPRSSVNDLVYMIEKGELQSIVIDPALEDVGAELVARCGSLRGVFTLGPSDLGRDLLAEAEAIGPQRLEAPQDLDHGDMCHLWFSGGTTGRPKAAVHTHRTLIETCYRNLIAYEYPFPVRYAALGPLSHSAYPQIFPAILTGGSATVLRAFDPEQFLRVTAEKQINFTFAVPTMLYALLEVAERTKIDVSSLQRVMYGAAPMASDPLGRLIDRFGSIFTQVYGASETIGAGTVLLASEHDRPDLITSCGRAAPGVDVILLDDEQNPVPLGSIGEVCIRSLSVMTEYFKEPELTAAALAGGWFHTGDLGRVNDEGYYTLVDRKKDMIISGGFNIYPVEIENVLMDEPSIHMAAVIGVPDPKWGESVHAAIMLRPGAKIDLDELLQTVRAQKGAVYTPKSVEIVDVLPLTPAGKVDKKVLRSRFWEGRERQI
ncbi:MAG: acyl-CoA synthetase [Ilumatobacteraceae bacterium]|nr:acyl-CoA synthetase [Ilumatobacteraceae bacterium]